MTDLEQALRAVACAWCGECQEAHPVYHSITDKCCTSHHADYPALAAVVQGMLEAQEKEHDRCIAGIQADQLTMANRENDLHEAKDTQLAEQAREIARLREALRTTEGHIRDTPPMLCADCIAEEKCECVPSCATRDRNYQLALQTVTAALLTTPEAGG